MQRNLRTLAAAGVVLGALWAGDSAQAQKSGGVLKVYLFDSPASMSIHQEATIAGEGPMMGVFNNLVMYKQDVPQSGFQSIVPDLATDWSWDEDQNYAHYRAIGTKEMRIRSLDTSPIDAHHCVAHVGWTATYARKSQPDITIDFDVHYLVQDLDGEPKIFGWVSGDEQALLKKHGII
jgi:hypothetical protein